ncbi:MAG: hypothetical protein NW226_10985 [Microscillaceae bacterium]|nr:hypothetical protein [Microscillaceae bacterium]
MHKTIFFWIICLGFWAELPAQENPQVKPALGGILSKFSTLRDLTISAGGDEVYFTIQSPTEEVSTISFLRKKNKQWSEPAIAPFSGKYKDLEPFLTPDGLRLYFVSDRPLDMASDKPKDFDIWYVSRKSLLDSWSAPVNLGIPVNTEYNEFYPALSANNNLYYTSDAPGSKGKDDIFMAKWENNQYINPTSLSDSINSKAYEFNAFVAPDESYLIYTIYQASDGLGSGDLYLSFRNTDGNWSKATNLGAVVNSTRMDYCPFVHSATQTLYFTSRRTAISTPKLGFAGMEKLLKTIQQYENGQSRIYQIQIKNLLLKN